MSSGLFPGAPRIASSLAECYFFRAHIELHLPRPDVTFLPYSLIIVLYFVLYLPVYTSVYIPQLFIIIHGTYGQPGEKSLFTEKLSSPA
jgi:FtsH-binding integral membrane protein